MSTLLSCSSHIFSVFFLFSHQEIDVSHPDFFSNAKLNGYIPPNKEVTLLHIAVFLNHISMWVVHAPRGTSPIRLLPQGYPRGTSPITLVCLMPCNTNKITLFQYLCDADQEGLLGQIYGAEVQLAF